MDPMGIVFSCIFLVFDGDFNFVSGVKRCQDPEQVFLVPMPGFKATDPQRRCQPNHFVQVDED